jgi:riboflavin kinase/FMN adenylyltransferase
MVLYPDTHGLQLIQTQDEKLEKLERMGLQNVIIYPFTFEFSRLTATEFIRDIIVNQLHVKKLVIGYDHQFGRNREGSIEFLKEIADTYSLDVIEIPAQIIEDSNVSSTKIREALRNGNIGLASSYLGEFYALKGTVVHGNALGRTIGFPTANLNIDDATKLIPSDGVYAVQIERDGIWYDGMMNIGYRPTISNSTGQTLEVHIFDFSEDLYGTMLTVSFISKLRDEVKFDGVDQLKQQLKHDEETIRALFATR